jgi:hypothetical protein
VLAAVASVRAEKGLICAVDSHPATGCGGEVKQVSPEAQAADTPVQLAAATPSAAPSASGAAPAKDSGSDSNVLTYAAIAVALGAATALVLAGRRRRDGR